MLHKDLLNTILKDLNTGYWELHNNPDKEVWSAKFYEDLGYKKEELSFTLEYFLKHLIHESDVDAFRDNFINYRRNGVNFKQYIQVLNKKGKHVLYRCATNDELPISLKFEIDVLFFFKMKLEPDQAITKDNFYYKETAQMTSTGSWYVDFQKKKSYWDFETRRILEYPEDYIPSLKKADSYFPKDSKQKILDLFFNCAMAGVPFSTEIKMITANHREFWVKAIGKPAYNEEKEIIGIRGVFQDIDDVKKKELSLKRSIDIITSQNSRLFNFAHIVSHNLRSHTGNLSQIIQLIEDADSSEEKIDLIGEVKNISNNLNITIEHLNEIVTIHANKQHKKEKIRFVDALSLVTSGINQTILNSKAEIHSDFSQLQEVEYLPAYMESILLNLITNAIKYKHPDKNPIIHIKTYIADGNKFLTISDNGRGIDLTLFKNKVFGMYKTFHYNEDAVGIGLFLTKNQVEAMNGRITVESEIDKGTSFIIEF